MENDKSELTERQKKEVEYHRARAAEHVDLLTRPFSFDVIHPTSRRWQNAYWEMYGFMLKQDLKGCRVLVVGCGFGDDALRLAKCGAEVYAFDLSPESLDIAKQLAIREGLDIQFEQMPAESLMYPSDFFDCVLASDILHHVNISYAMKEVIRVSRNNALFVVNEVYSHSFTDRIRHSKVVENYLYPLMQNFVYSGEKPYITEDERKLTERDIAEITKPLVKLELEKYFNFFVRRIVPDRSEIVNKPDRLLLIALKPIAHVLAGRILCAGHISK